jgi:hypothetical protein
VPRPPPPCPTPPDSDSETDRARRSYEPVNKGDAIGRYRPASVEDAPACEISHRPHPVKDVSAEYIEVTHEGGRSIRYLCASLHDYDIGTSSAVDKFDVDFSAGAEAATPTTHELYVIAEDSGEEEVSDDEEERARRDEIRAGKRVARTASAAGSGDEDIQLEGGQSQCVFRSRSTGSSRGRVHSSIGNRSIRLPVDHGDFGPSKTAERRYVVRKWKAERGDDLVGLRGMPAVSDTERDTADREFEAQHFTRDANERVLKGPEVFSWAEEELRPSATGADTRATGDAASHVPNSKEYQKLSSRVSGAYAGSKSSYAHSTRQTRTKITRRGEQRTWKGSEESEEGDTSPHEGYQWQGIRQDSGDAGRRRRRVKHSFLPRDGFTRGPKRSRTKRRLSNQAYPKYYTSRAAFTSSLTQRAGRTRTFGGPDAGYVSDKRSRSKAARRTAVSLDPPERQGPPRSSVWQRVDEVSSQVTAERPVRTSSTRDPANRRPGRRSVDTSADTRQRVFSGEQSRTSYSEEPGDNTTDDSDPPAASSEPLDVSNNIMPEHYTSYGVETERVAVREKSSKSHTKERKLRKEPSSLKSAASNLVRYLAGASTRPSRTTATSRKPTSARDKYRSSDTSRSRRNAS